MMRQIHRWVSFPLVLFLLLVTFTGLVLQSQEVGEALEGEKEAPKVASLPDDVAIAADLQKALSAARSAKSDLPVQRIELDYARGQAKARLAVSARGGPSVQVDLKSGETKMEDKPKTNLHVLMIQLHTGKMFGPMGLFIILVAGIIFLILTVTGFLVYLDMWKRRKGAGKSGLFWK